MRGGRSNHAPAWTNPCSAVGKETLSVSKDSSMDCLSLVGFFSAHGTKEQLPEGDQNTSAL